MPVGAYIIQAPVGDVPVRQLYAVPTDVVPLGQELSAIVIYVSFIAT